MNDLPVPSPAHASALLMQIERLVRSDIEPTRIQAVLDMYNAERNRAQLEEFNRALAGLQSEIFEVSASGRNPTFRTAYPKLHDLLKESQPYRSKYGFSIRFGTSLQKTEAPAPREGWQRVVLIISHTGGHWEEHYIDGPPDISRSERVPRAAVQSIGSTNTYLRRYLFMMILNLVPGGDPHDNDGESGGLTPLTPEQIDEVKKLIEEAGLTADEVSSLLKAVDATTLAEITSRYYPRLVNTLINRKKRKEEEVDGNE